MSIIHNGYCFVKNNNIVIIWRPIIHLDVLLPISHVGLCYVLFDTSKPKHHYDSLQFSSFEFIGSPRNIVQTLCEKLNKAVHLVN